jgi:hypothetical protein
MYEYQPIDLAKAVSSKKQICYSFREASKKDNKIGVYFGQHADFQSAALPTELPGHDTCAALYGIEFAVARKKAQPRLSQQNKAF